MRAVRYHAFGGPEQVRVEDVPVPEPAPGQVRVRVRAAALNPVDVKILSGSFAGATPPRTLGHDFAGELDAGSSGSVSQPAHEGGGRVFGSGQAMGARFDGALAELVVVPAGCVAAMPARLSFEQAAALGVPWLTAQLCVEAAQPAPGKTVVVYGAGGGVGSAFLALAQKSGARLVAVTSDPERARRRGASDVVDRRGGDVEARLRALGDIHVIVDTVGGRWFEMGVGLLAPYGRILSVGVTGGESAKVTLDLPAFYRRAAQIVGINLTIVPPEERGARLQAIARAFDQDPSLEPPEVETLPLERAAEALARVARYGEHKKLVLLP